MDVSVLCMGVLEGERSVGGPYQPIQSENQASRQKSEDELLHARDGDAKTSTSRRSPGRTAVRATRSIL
jgi:hypothetical protein